MCVVNELKFEKHYFKASPFVKIKLMATTPWGWIYHIKARQLPAPEIFSWTWCVEENGCLTPWDTQDTQDNCIRACNTHFKGVVRECIKEETAPPTPVKDHDGNKPICNRCGGKGTLQMVGVPYHCPDCKGYGRIHDI